MRMEVNVFRVCKDRAERRGGQGLQEYAWVCEKERKEGKSHVCLQHGSRVIREIKGATPAPKKKGCREQASKGHGA